MGTQEINDPGASASEGSSAPENADPLIPLGVLFVHGIGKQDRGDTLISFGEPIYGFIRDWLQGASRSDRGDSFEVVVQDTVLRNSDDAQAPSNTTLSMSFTAAGEAHATKFLCAESWWATNFPAPSFSELAVWTLSIGPWMAQRHFNLRFLRAATLRESLTDAKSMVQTEIATHLPPSAMNFATASFQLVAWLLPYAYVAATRVIAFLLSFLVGLAAQIGIAALFVLSVIPPTRSFVLRVQLALAESIGDSYVLLKSPLRLDAMVSQVQRDILWLSSRCERVAVIAHSQGAAVSHQALRARPFEKLGLFLTFGAAIGRLRALRHVQEGRAFASFALRLLGTAGIVVGVFILTGATLEAGWGVGLIGVGGIALIVSFPMTPKVDAAVPPSELILPRLGEVDGFTWIDFYASADPVSEGPISTEPVRGLTSHRITNTNSTFRDHTTYWENREGFVSRVCFALARLASWSNLRGLTAPDELVVSTATQRRTERVDVLNVGRMLAGLTTASFAVGLGWSHLQVLARELFQVASAVPDLVSDSIAANLRSFAQTRLGAALGGGLVVAVAVAAIYRFAVVAPWKGWDRRQTTEMFARRLPHSRLPWQLSLGMVIMLLPLLPSVRFFGGPSPWLVLPAMSLLLVVVLVLSPGSSELHQVSAELSIIDRDKRITAHTVRLPNRFLHSSYLGLTTRDGVAWICCGPTQCLARVELATGRLATVDIGAVPISVATGEESVWVATDEHVLRIDPRRMTILKSIALSPGLQGIAVGAAGVWITNEETSTLLRLDPSTGQVEALIPVGALPGGVVVHQGSVWVVNRGSASLSKIDPLRGERVAEIQLKAVPWAAPVGNSSGVWIYDMRGQILRVDTTSASVASRVGVPRETRIGGIAADENSVWFVDGWRKKLACIASGSVGTEIVLPGRGQEIGIDGGWLAVLTYSNPVPLTLPEDH